ncbi:hypothetical protein HK104_008403 [Borealophlyctis nickersoniae]|nr:hypothetical protein HK104_008403 [Borealophlyctis nickersoniae]
MLKRFKAEGVAVFGAVLYGVTVSIGMIAEGASGRAWHSRPAIVTIYSAVGFAQGVIEISRFVVPRYLVGSHLLKLRYVEAAIHITFALARLPSFLIVDKFLSRLPVAFFPVIALSGAILTTALWTRIGGADEDITQFLQMEDATYPIPRPTILQAFASTFSSIAQGIRIIFSKRRFAFLLLAWSVPLGLVPLFNVLVNFDYLAVGLCSAGEVVGAGLVVVLNSKVHTPIPWLRFLSVTLLITWLAQLSFFFDLWALVIAITVLVFNLGWVPADISTLSYIQSQPFDDSSSAPISTLAAVATTLYIPAVLLQAGIAAAVGITGNFLVLASALTGAAVVVFAASFVPKGSRAVNPRLQDFEGW